MTAHPEAPWPRRAASAPVFVGRRGPLALVDEAWADARAGRPGVVWVEGEAGAGKSAVLARAVAGRRASAVLTATGDAAETGLAHGLLDQLLADLPPALLDRFPLLRPDRDPRADPLAVGADLLGALGAVPGEDPVLLVLDDLQWADPASVRVLVFTLRRLRHDRVLVLAGVRVAGSGPDAREPDPADAWWERLPAAGRTIRRVRLEGLEPAELSELAAAVGRPLGSTGAAERLWRHTRGHPLHARALLEELPPEVLAGSADALPAPRSLSSVVLVRLARAAPATEALVVATSVLGESAPLALAAAVAGLDDPAAALDEAVGMGLVEELPGGPTVRIGFVHPLVRAAIRGDLPPMRRRALHAASAGLLSGRVALDHRVAAAAGPDPELAAELEDLVGEPGAALAGSEAADLLHAAADLSTDPDDRERRLLAAASRLLADGEVARAVALEGAVEGCRPGPWRTAVLGQLALVTGRFGVARERLEAALATGAPGDGRPGDRARAGSAAHLAVLHLLRGDPTRAIETAGVALAHPARGDDVRLPAGLALILGLAVAGRGDDARAILDRAGGDDGRAPPVDTLTLRGMLATLGGDDATASLHLDEAVHRARAGEPVRALALALAFRPAVADRIGVPDGVVEGFELAITLARDGGTALPGALAHTFAAEALAIRGRGDEARTHLAAGDDARPALVGRRPVRGGRGGGARGGRGRSAGGAAGARAGAGADGAGGGRRPRRARPAGARGRGAAGPGPGRRGHGGARRPRPARHRPVRRRRRPAAGPARRALALGGRRGRRRRGRPPRGRPPGDRDRAPSARRRRAPGRRRPPARRPRHPRPPRCRAVVRPRRGAAAHRRARRRRRPAAIPARSG